VRECVNDGGHKLRYAKVERRAFMTAEVERNASVLARRRTATLRRPRAEQEPPVRRGHVRRRSSHCERLAGVDLVVPTGGRTDQASFSKTTKNRPLGKACLIEGPWFQP
jgi:hypothetical protein